MVRPQSGGHSGVLGWRVGEVSLSHMEWRQGGEVLRNLGLRKRRESGKTDTDVRVRWVLVRRVEGSMGVVFWPPEPSATVMWTDILQL